MKIRSILSVLFVPERAGLVVLFAFTILAVAGYGLFGLHPSLLRFVPGLAFIYGPAFTFFAQGHVWLAAAVLVVYLVQKAGWQWLPAFGAIYVVSFVSEFAGTGYGIPFGSYHYTDLLGPMWFGRVPWVIPLSWFSMAVPAYVLAWNRFPGLQQRRSRVLTAALLLLIWDLSLDPAMSYLTSYWMWGEPGVYYGMPLVNLFGWFLTGTVIMLLLSALGVDRWARRLSAKWTAAYYLTVLLMPFGMVLVAGLQVAVFITVAAVGAAGWFVVGRGPGMGGRKAREAALKTVPGRDGMRMSGARIAPPTTDLTGVFFRNHSRSFAFASRLLPRRERQLVGSLYAFCRTTDDLVDQRTGSTPADVVNDLNAWLARAEAAYSGKASGLQWLDELMSASREAGVPFELVRQMVEGVGMDVGPVAFATIDELDRYTYKVASVVGLWLCRLYGISDQETLQRAAAMGRAMQLTNILRDVGEDLRQGRVYLPAALMDRHGVTRADLYAMAAGGEITPAYRSLIRELLARAEAEYDYAFPGFAALPPAFGRASATAAAVYRGIHDEIVRNDFDNLRRRASTGLPGKVRLAAGGLVRLHRQRYAATHASKPGSTVVRQVHEATQQGMKSWCVLLTYMFTLVMASPSIAFAIDTADASWLNQLRDYYVQAVEDEVVLEEAQRTVAAARRDDPMTRAYAAAFTVLQAKHALWPHRKVHFLREGLEKLDRLVADHPGAVEIRYLRLLSCYFLPSFLGRGWSVRQDFAVLAGILPGAAGRFPAELFTHMVRFVLEHSDPDPVDRARLSAVLRGDDPEYKRLPFPD